MHVSLKGLLAILLLIALIGSTAEANFLIGDFNKDCKVNIADLSLLASYWLDSDLTCSETGLAGHWKLDETIDVTAGDSSGNNRNGTVNGYAIWRPDGGQIAGAIELDGANDDIQITDYKGITGTNPRTCSAWINTNHVNGEIISWGQNGVAGGRWVFKINDEGFLSLETGQGYLTGSTWVNDGIWHHVAAVSDGTDTDSIQLFVDGILDRIGDIKSQEINTSSDQDVRIGIFSNSGNFYKGLIDDVRIYDKALNLEEVWTLAHTNSTEIGCVDADNGNQIDFTDFAMMAKNWLNEVKPIVINEFLAGNDTYYPTTVDGDQVYPDWIELYNQTGAEIDLEGWYLTDEEDDLVKWQFPKGYVLGTGEYFVVYASKKELEDYPGNYPYVDDDGFLHTNFKLTTDGEYLALVKPDGETIAHEYISFEYDDYLFGYPKQEDDISYGLLYNEERYFSEPTPGEQNNGVFMGYMADTNFSHDRGFYDGRFDLKISCKTRDAIIRYTTNGSEPTEITNGTTYTGPITIDKTTTLRAIAHKPGWVTSNVDTQTYIFVEDVIRQSPDGELPTSDWTWGSNGQIINYGMDPDVVDSEDYGGIVDDSLLAIPSISIVTDFANLLDRQTGIYVNAMRHGMEWERPASVELLNPDGSKGFHINAGLRIRGGYSRNNSNPKHAFRLFFRGQYGSPKLEFPMFGNEGVASFDKIDLRTSQNYSWSYGRDRRNTMCREVFSRDLQRDMGQPYTRSCYYHLYLNGQYWGLFQTQERSEARYAASYFGGDVEDYDVVKVDGGIGRPYTIEATDGNLDAYERLWTVADEVGFKSNESYYRIQGMNPDHTDNPEYEKLVDVENLIDYMICTYYVGDFDGPVSWFLGNEKPNNYYGIYNRESRDGFKFFRHDGEHTLFPGWDRTGPWPAGETFNRFNPQWLHQELTKNSEYRIRFADRTHQYFFNSGLLDPHQARANFLERADQIDMAIIAESARWGDSRRGDSAEPYTKETWLDEIDNVAFNYFPWRTDDVVRQLQNKGWYPEVEAPIFHINALHRHGGHISPEDQISMTSEEGEIFYTTDGQYPRLPDNEFRIDVGSLVSENAPKRVHIPVNADDGFSTAPPPAAHWKFNGNFLDSAYESETPNDGYRWGEDVHFVTDHMDNEFSAASFDGRDDFVYIPNDTDFFDITGDITIACWIKFSEHHDQAGIVTKGNSSWKLSLASAEGKLRFYLKDVGNLISNSTWHDDKWHHVAAVRNYDTMSFYVDGEEDGTLEIEDPNSQTATTWWWVFIGSNYELWYDEDNDTTRNIESFEGDIDDVRIYKEALEADEIERIMQEGEFWANRIYDDTEWIYGDGIGDSGGGGVGFDPDEVFDPYIDIDIEPNMLDENSTCCIRIPFTATSPEDIVNMSLRIRYDDGFVAYINGTEVARANFTGLPEWESKAEQENPDPNAIRFEEFDISRHVRLLRTGNNLLGIQGLNFDKLDADFLISAELVIGQNVSIAETAIHYTAPFTIDKSTLIKARSIDTSGQWSALTEAVFGIGPVAENLSITEFMYHPTEGIADPNSEFIELKNTGEDPINLNLVSFTDGIDYTFGDFELEGEEYVVIVRRQEAFDEQYPGFDGVIAGEFEGSLENAGEKVRLADAAGRTIGEFKYEDGWWDMTDGEGFSLTLRDRIHDDLALLEEDLVAHWRFDEKSSAVAPDSSINGHDGTLVGTVIWRRLRGKMDGAILFDGDEGYVEVTDFKGITGSGRRTCAAWIKAAATSGEIVGWGNPGSGTQWVFAVDEDGRLKVDVGGGFVVGSNIVNDNQWHHVAVVSNGGNSNGIELYVDGQPDPASDSSSHSINTGDENDVTIGVFLNEEGSDDPEMYFNGLVDDLRIYDVMLDHEVITALAKLPDLLDGKEYWRPSAFADGSPGHDDTGDIPEPGDIVINEILSHSHAQASDWIELHNTTDHTISIGGWFLSDDNDDFRKFRIPSGTSISPGGYKVFNETTDFGNPDNAAAVRPFALSENGETLYLRSADSQGNFTGYFEEEKFGTAETNVAFGRFQKSTGTFNFVAMSSNTPNSNNDDPLVGPIVISEIMYNPPSGDSYDHNEYEYIELLNTSSLPVVLQEFDNEAQEYVPWRFTDGIDYEFEPGTVLGPGERLIVAKNLDAFTERYGEPDILLQGPYEGRLNNGGEKVTLSKPADAVNDRYYYIRVDQVNYDNSSPWPLEAGGQDKSLVRIDDSEYGNDVTNWEAADPSPGQ